MTNDLLTTLITTMQALVILLSAQVAALPDQQPAANKALMNQEAPSSFITPKTKEPTQDPISFTAINNLYKDAVINILCKGSGKFTGGTATGVIISPTGLMLTNAHMAQYMLLEQLTNAPIECTVRTGRPAKGAYRAKVVYMPPAWVAQNARQITKRKQTGTGENDYALLQITQPVDVQVQMPKIFTYVQPNPGILATDTDKDVLVRAYPAEFLGSNIAVRALRPVATVTTIGDMATFSKKGETNTPNRDLISLGGTIVAQGGSSGGAVISTAAKLIGIIVTSTRTKETKDRDLKAITLSHINISLKQATGKSLDELIALPAEEIFDTYKAELIHSAQILADAYNK